MLKLSKIVSRSTNKLSPWVSLSEKAVLIPEKSEDLIFHSLQQSDYVTTLAVSKKGMIPLVKQFRPAVETVTYELPGGLLDCDEAPEIVAGNEIYEETGHCVIDKPHLMGCLFPDTGRLENRLWAYFAKITEKPVESWVPEDGVETILVNVKDLKDMIQDGRFNHALHLGVLGLAITLGFFKWGNNERA